MNTLTMVGNLGKDVEKGETKEGDLFCKGSVADNRGNETYWFDFIAFEKPAELLVEYGKKGKQVHFRGWMRSYKSNGGAPRWQLVIEDVQFLGNVEDTEEE
jgi:single-stranded DNA-binding protein